jgi:hypothetical protein
MDEPAGVVMTGVSRSWRSHRRGNYVWLARGPAAAPTQRGHVEGRVASVSADRLIVVTEPARDRMSVAAADLRRLWVRRGATLQSGLQMAAIGAVIGLAAASQDEEPSEPRVGPGPGVFTALGAVMGAVAGISRPRVWWERVRLPTPPERQDRGRL